MRIVDIPGYAAIVLNKVVYVGIVEGNNLYTIKFEGNHALKVSQSDFDRAAFIRMLRGEE